MIPQCSVYLGPLEQHAAGKTSQEPIQWSSDTEEAFYASQKHLHRNKSITIPQPDDQLWLVTDGAVKNPGLGATLYVQRQNKTFVARYFSAKLKER